MGQKRRRSWTGGDSEGQKRFKNRAALKKEREEYMIGRIRELIEQGLTRTDWDERRERHECMKEHPERFCCLCNPRADGDDDEDDGEGLSDEEADMSDSWRDGSASDGENSPTYSAI